MGRIQTDSFRLDLGRFGGGGTGVGLATATGGCGAAIVEVDSVELTHRFLAHFVYSLFGALMSALLRLIRCTSAVLRGAVRLFPVALYVNVIGCVRQGLETADFRVPNTFNIGFHLGF